MWFCYTVASSVIFARHSVRALGRICMFSFYYELNKLELDEGKRPCLLSAKISTPSFLSGLNRL